MDRNNRQKKGLSNKKEKNKLPATEDAKDDMSMIQKADENFSRCPT